MISIVLQGAAMGSHVGSTDNLIVGILYQSELPSVETYIFELYMIYEILILT